MALLDIYTDRQYEWKDVLRANMRKVGLNFVATYTTRFMYATLAKVLAAIFSILASWLWVLQILGAQLETRWGLQVLSTSEKIRP